MSDRKILLLDASREQSLRFLLPAGLGLTGKILHPAFSGIQDDAFAVPASPEANASLIHTSFACFLGAVYNNKIALSDYGRKGGNISAR